MNNWIDYFYFFLFGFVLLLSMLGLWSARIMPGTDRWSRRYFLYYFFVLMVNSLLGILEMFIPYISVPMALVYLVLYLESVALSLPLLMPTVFLLHACGKSLRGSRLLYAAICLWGLYLAVLAVSLFADGFFTITPGVQYLRGPLYPLIPLPMDLLILLNLAGAFRYRKQLSRKTFLSFLTVSLPMAAALSVHLFIDVFALIDICVVLSGLTMYSLIISDMIEQDLRRQREIAEQQREIANQRASIMVLQMRPHFIYNTLMSIYSLCNLDPQKARQVTMDFTDYLRKNFNAVASSEMIPFSAELEHTRAYLAVEQAQYEEMLLVEYDTQFTHFRLPPLTLQPIAENAVKHGMNPYSGPLHVAIRTYHKDSSGVIIVEDNGPGFDPADNSEPHTALATIRQKLKLMCGGTLEISSRDGGGTAVTVTIPDRSPEA